MKKINAVKEEIKIKITKKILQRFEESSIINEKEFLKVIGKFLNSKFLLGIK